MSKAPAPAPVTFRALESRRDFDQCAEVQRETWGRDFPEVVPPSILMICQKVSGVAAGAFDSQDGLLGFVFGLSGLRHGRPAHWSHMLAIRPEARGLGLGKGLKLYQRQRLIEVGIEVVYWTYDPLVARNANLNLNRLGARPVEYVEDMYGEDMGSELDRGLGSDRFVVAWELEAPRVEAALAGQAPVEESRFAQAPVVNTLREGGCSRPRLSLEATLPELPAVRVEVPDRIHDVRAQSPDTARAWRESTRQAFVGYLGRGYEVEGFRIDSQERRGFYLLTRTLEETRK